ncbi:MAG: hypothetical protein LKJ87_03365 [Bacteroidales bacterium]|jgi:hypothetical protein|nr:hypothetical protein [Bacteroidales bacterium]
MSEKKSKTEAPEQEAQSPEVAQAAQGADVNKEPAAVVEQEDVQAAVVVLAYKGTEEQVKRVWEKMAVLPMIVLAYYDEEKLQDVLAKIVADESIADDFIFVPANVIPCKPVNLEELSVPYVYTTSRGERIYNSRVPMAFGKSKLVELLAASDAKDDEEFIRVYYGRYRHYPVEVGFTFGNFITPVTRANPCEHGVMEALVRKRFISASAEGYKAISSLIEKTLLS